MTQEFSGVKYLMESGFNKLPKEIGTIVYRGAGEIESNFAKTLTVGDNFNFSGRFTSTSLQKHTAEMFRVANGGDVLWQIESKTGINLTLINSSEAEILFNTMTNYQLIDIVPHATDPNILTYIIKEL